MTSTLLHGACLGGDQATVEYLIRKGCDPRGRNSRGLLPIHYAAMYGHQRLLELFVDEFRVGEDAESTGALNKESTPLVLAATNGHSQAV